MASSKAKILEQMISQRKAEVGTDEGEDAFFGFYVVEQMLKDYELDFDELNNGIVDGGGDGGIDAIYTLLNGELLEEDSDALQIKKDVVIDLVIIQAKNTGGFGEEPLNKVTASAGDLFNFSVELDDLKTVYKGDLLNKIDIFRKIFLRYASRFPKVNVRYFYAALGEDIHENVERKVKPLRDAVVAQLGDCNVEFTFAGVEKLLEYARRAPLTAKELNIEGSPISTKDGGYIALVKLVSFYEFITDGNRLIKSFFDANVRDYQGRIEVNNAIRETLANPSGEDFWWLNNGVTITTTKAVIGSGKLMIEDPQIVNGLQSSHEIFSHFSSGGDREDTRMISVRVINPVDEKSRLKIIKATNSQTSVPFASLRATDPIHLDIEGYFAARGFFYDRRKNYYKNLGKPADRIISIQYLSQLMTAILLREPNTARARPSTLIKDDNGYARIFNRDVDVEAYLNAVMIQRSVDAQLKVYGGLVTSVIGNIKFHVSMYLVAVHFHKTTYSADAIRRFKIEEMLVDEIRNAIGVVLAIYNELGANDRVAKGEEFVTRVREAIAAENARFAQSMRERAAQGAEGKHPEEQSEERTALVVSRKVDPGEPAPLF